MPWAPDYVDVDQLISFVKANAANPFVATYGTAASRAVDDYCNRQFGQLDEVGTFNYAGCDAVQLRDGRWLVAVDDVQDTGGLVVTVDGSTVAAGVDGYQLWPRNVVAKGDVYTAITLPTAPGVVDVDVTAKFGRSPVPANVTGAVWLQVNRWNVRRESPYGTAGSPSEGSEVRLSALLDPDVRTLLSGGHMVRARMPR